MKKSVKHKRFVAAAVAGTVVAVAWYSAATRNVTDLGVGEPEPVVSVVEKAGSAADAGDAASAVTEDPRVQEIRELIAEERALSRAVGSGDRLERDPSSPGEEAGAMKATDREAAPGSIVAKARDSVAQADALLTDDQRRASAALRPATSEAYKARMADISELRRELSAASSADGVVAYPSN